MHDAIPRQVRAWAHITTERYVSRLPARVDREQFYVEAELAAWKALRSYDPGYRVQLRSHVIRQVRNALRETARTRPHCHVPRSMLPEFASGAPWLQPPVELDAIHTNGDGDERAAAEYVLPAAPSAEACALGDAPQDDRFEQLLLLLPRDEREVIDLRYRGLLTQPEIGARTDRCVEAVRKRERRALDRLREELTRRAA